MLSVTTATRGRSPFLGVASVVMTFWPLHTAPNAPAAPTAPSTAGHGVNPLQPETVLQGILHGEPEDVRALSGFPQPVEGCIRQCYINHESRVDACWSDYDQCLAEGPPGEDPEHRRQICGIQLDNCLRISDIRRDLCVSLCLFRWEPI